MRIGFGSAGKDRSGFLFLNLASALTPWREVFQQRSVALLLGVGFIEIRIRLFISKTGQARPGQVRDGIVWFGRRRRGYVQACGFTCWSMEEGEKGNTTEYLVGSFCGRAEG
jgi:hypothetical protein